MPWDGTTATSITAAMNTGLRGGEHPVFPADCRECRDPVIRDGVRVQFYIGTVIELCKKIFQNINFVVGMSDIKEFYLRCL